MTAALGQFLILGSLLAASLGAVLAFTAAIRKNEQAYSWARRLAYLYAAMIIGANLLMVYALVNNDFSVSYVAQVGSTTIPLWVKVVSLWSSLEGSILFWGFVLGLYVAVAMKSIGDKHPDAMPYSAGVWLSVATFFSFLIAAPAQPFIHIPNPMPDGPGPNPLLQNHILMAIHPPFLYLGYVGMTIPFGLASAALLTGRFGQDVLRTLRRWLIIPWAFLAVAIVLGGWWAYEVLGWGGYWAWDPVENASFLPWLTATAAIHSAIVMERKNSLKGWTATLVLSTFLLTVLGTFMTRSGVFNSVHSFTQSSIGPTLLFFLAGALLWSVFLLATRIDKIGDEQALNAGASREGMFLVNNLLFVLFTLTVLIGTVFPLIVEAVSGKQMSVGRPYFDKMSIPIGVALLLLMGIGPALPWGRATKEQIRKALLAPSIVGVVMMAVGWFLGLRNAWALVTMLFGGFAAWVTMREMWLPSVQRWRAGKRNIADLVVETPLVRSRRRFGAYVVHAAVIVIIVAIAVSGTMQTSKQVEMRKGDSATVGSYTLTFLGTDLLPEDHRQSLISRVAIHEDGKLIDTLTPRMNYYERQREPIGSPSVHTGWGEDLYLSVLNVDDRNQTVALQVMINPMVGWIWICTGLMFAGSLLVLIPTGRRSEIASAPARVSTGDSSALGATPVAFSQEK